jgi:hypothetical protein
MIIGRYESRRDEAKVDVKAKMTVIATLIIVMLTT